MKTESDSDNDNEEKVNKDGVIEYCPKTMSRMIQFKDKSSMSLYKTKFSKLLKHTRKTYDMHKQLWAMAIYHTDGSLIYSKMFKGKELYEVNRLEWYVFFNSLLFSSSQVNSNSSSSNSNGECISSLTDFSVKTLCRQNDYEQLLCTFGSIGDDDDVKRRWLSWRKMNGDMNESQVSTKHFRHMIEWFYDNYGQRILFFSLGLHGRSKKYQVILELPKAIITPHNNILNPDDVDHRLLVNYCRGMTTYLVSEFKSVVYE